MDEYTLAMETLERHGITDASFASSLGDEIRAAIERWLDLNGISDLEDKA